MAKPYPRCLAPSRGYRYRLPMFLLLRDYPELTVVRRCDDPNPFVYSGTGNIKKLKDDLFKDENLLEMSVNLLGGSFKLRHLAFSGSHDITKDEWDGTEEFNFSRTDEYYSEKTDSFGAILFGVAQANVFSFPYPKSVDKKNYAALKATGAKTQQKEGIEQELVGALGAYGNNMTQMRAWLHVNHHPNILNYWHMQMDVYGVGHDGYFKYEDKSAEAKHVRQKLREYITHIAIYESGTAYHISRKYYRRGTGCLSDASDKLTNKLSHYFFKFSIS